MEKDVIDTEEEVKELPPTTAEEEDATVEAESLPVDTISAIVEGIVEKVIPAALQAAKPRAETPEERRQLELEVRDEWQRQREEPHFWIEFQRLGEEDKDDQVYVGVNGVSYWYKKNERVPVPQSVLDVLANTKTTSYEPTYDHVSGQMKMRQVTYHRFPYQFYGAATREEVVAWKERNSRQLE